MIEELRILKEIVGDLSGLGIWVLAGYIFMRLSIVAALVYTARHIINVVKSIFCAGITKYEADRILNENHKLKLKMEECKSESKIELEKVQHMYKLLKESRGDKNG